MRYLYDVLLLVAYVGLIIFTRVVFHVGENLEFVTAASITAGYFFKYKKLALLVPLFGMAITDAFIGNTKIFLFTWSAYILAPFLGILLAKLKKEFFPSLVGVQISGIIFTVVFFLWTNFGVVVVSNMYSKDLSGLFRSYVNGLPFLQNQLLGNLISVPLVFVATFTILSTLKYFRTNKSLQFDY